MNFGRHSISATRPVVIFDARFDADCELFTAATPDGFAVYRTWPLTLIRKRELSGGTLAAVLPCHASSMLFLLGGGRSPRYPPNKVIVWDDILGREVAELEFRERVRGFASRRGWLAVALYRRVVLFEIGERISRHAEWDTSDNPRGLLAMATSAYATLLVMPGRQLGHVQLVHLPACDPPTPLGPPPAGVPPRPPAPPSKHPVAIIAAHTSRLTTLAVPPSGTLLATTSEAGTLVRVWDARSGRLVRELRRGADKAEIYGVAFRPDERELAVWSDKGTVHLFAVAAGASGGNKQSSLSPLAPFLPLPKYFESEWSYAQYRLPSQATHIALSQTSIRTPGRDPDVPDADRCVVGWITAPPAGAPSDASALREHQLVALTWTGGWYRLALPGASSIAAAASPAVPPQSPTRTSLAAQRVPLSASPPPSRTPVPQPVRNPPATSAGSSRADKGKGKQRERDKDKEKSSSQCTLVEFRRFGRFDGWL